MLRFGLLARGILMGAIATSSELATAQPFPHKPIRIVTNDVGGGPDFIARMLAQGITDGLGQPIIVENRPSGFVQVETAARALPDGYTLLVSGGVTWMLPLMQKTSWDPLRDFSTVTFTSSSPNVLVVHPSVPVKSVKELIDLAQAKNGQLNYSAGAPGSSNHLSAEMFKVMAGVNIVRIAYKGSGPALNGLIAGETQVMFSPTASATPQIKSGKVRALGVTSAQPTALVPGIPPIAASGLPGYEVVSFDAVFAPAKTPVAIVRRLNQEIVRFVNRPDTKEKMLIAGNDVVGNSPEEMAEKVKSEMTKWRKVVKEIGLSAL